MKKTLGLVGGILFVAGMTTLGQAIWQFKGQPEVFTSLPAVCGLIIMVVGYFFWTRFGGNVFLKNLF